MEELTIEQKAQRYDEAIKKLRDFYRDYDTVSRLIDVKEELANLFPELKESEESEDERIRKSLSAYFAKFKPNDMWDDDVSYGDIIAWFKKQEKQELNDDEDILQRFSFYSYKNEPNILYLSGLYVNSKHRNKGIGTKILTIADKVAASMCCNFIRLKTKIGSNAERLYRRNGYNTFKKEGNQVWLEKQGGQKPVISDDAIREGIAHFGITQYQIDNWLKKYVDVENQGEQELLVTNVEKNIHPIVVKKTGVGRCAVAHEQKPALNVGPKFKKEEWLVENHPNNYARFLQILEIYNFNGKNNYVVSRDLHNDEDVAESEFIETHWHPFNIKDAKDGDVLASKDAVFIFKHKDKTGLSICRSYCEVIGNSKLGFGFDFSINGVYPATKERRDTLFAKMKEAGYEWDANKKELKKIKQKPADKIEPTFNVGDKIQYSKGCGTIMTIEKIENGEYIFSNNMGHTTIESGNEWYLVNPVEQKPAWSEEDERYLSYAIHAVEDMLGNNGRNTVTWLKSIKDRYTWKPSYEQMKALWNVYQGGKEQAELATLYNDLKKL